MLDSEKTTSSSDSHVKIEIGTERMLVDFGVSGSDSEDIDQESIDWNYMRSSSLSDYQEVWIVNSYSKKSEGHFSVGLVLGGDDPGLTNSGGFSTDEVGRAEEHWPTGVYITTETYHNHGGDVESDEPRRHRRTQQYPTQGGNQESVDFDNPVTTMSMTPPRSLEDILNEYRDRQTQLARLQAELAETTDPDMQKFLQDQINVETNILADITTAALAAGATQADLDQINSEAQTAAENDPIEHDEGDGGDSVLFAAFLGGHLGVLQGVLNGQNGVTDIVIGMGNLGNITSPGGIITMLMGNDPTITPPDWSNGLAATEDPELHDWSKFLGGQGVVLLLTLGLSGGAGAGGTATIQQHAGEPLHMSVIVSQGDISLCTHQVIVSADLTVTRIVTANQVATGNALKSVVVELPSATSAIAKQQQLMSLANVGKYDAIYNSCVSHVCDILTAGGLNSPAPGGSMRLRFLLNLLKGK